MYPQAINAYEQVLRIHAKSTYAWEGLGGIYRDIKKYDEAINAYQQELRIDPKSTFAWFNLGVTYYDMKQYPKAINAYLQVLQINPNQSSKLNITTRFNLGIAYSDIGDQANVIAVYDKLKVLDAHRAANYFDALILLKKAQYQSPYDFADNNNYRHANLQSRKSLRRQAVFDGEAEVRWDTGIEPDINTNEKQHREWVTYSKRVRKAFTDAMAEAMPVF